MLRGFPGLRRFDPGSFRLSVTFPSRPTGVYMGLMLAFLLALQQDPVHAAVRKGITHLKTQAAAAGEQRDLVLWTLVKVDVSASDPLVAELLRELLAKPVESTRLAALEAMILNALDPAAYRSRIGHCAQFLIDNQAADGRWDAGSPVEPPKLPPEPPEPERKQNGVREFGQPSKFRVFPKVLLEKRREGAEKGDAPNSLWAALGLVECERSGFLAPKETHEKAVKAWRVGEVEVADRISGLAAHQFLGGIKWKQDPDILGALDRLADPKRPTDPKSLLTLKRAMLYLDSVKLGDREWWPEGRKVLLDSQSPDGSWDNLENTCAALQYLYVPRYSGIPEYPELRRNGRK